MRERILEKLQSKVVWVTAVPLIASLVVRFTGIEIGQVLETIVTLLALFGILNDPHDRTQF